MAPSPSHAPGPHGDASTSSAPQESSIDLATRLASRLCHDLVSPVGATVNGIDLIREMGVSKGAEEIDLLGQSAERAARLLQFYRLTFGAVTDPQAEVARSALYKSAVAPIATRRVTLACSGESGPALPRTVARLAALMLLCGRGLIRREGRLHLGLEPEASLPLGVSIEGPDLAPEPELLDRLRGHGPERLPATPQIEFALIRPAAEAAGAELGLKQADGGITLTAGAQV